MKKRTLKNNFVKVGSKWDIYLPNFIKNIFYITRGLENDTNVWRVFDGLVGGISLIGPDLLILKFIQKFGKSIKQARILSRLKTTASKGDNLDPSKLNKLKRESKLPKDINMLTTVQKMQKYKILENIKFYGGRFNKYMNDILEYIKNSLKRDIDIGNMNLKIF